MTKAFEKPDIKSSRGESDALQSALRKKIHLIVGRDSNERLAAMMQSMASRRAETEMIAAPRAQLFPRSFLQKL